MNKVMDKDLDDMNKDMDKEMVHDNMTKDMDKEMVHHDMIKDMDKEMVHHDMIKDMDKEMVHHGMSKDMDKEMVHHDMNKDMGKDLDDMNEDLGKDLNDMNKVMDKDLDGMNKDMDKEMVHHDMIKDMDKEMVHQDMSKDMDKAMVHNDMNKDMGKDLDGMNKDMGKDLDDMNKDMGKEMIHHDMNKDMDKEMVHHDMNKDMGKELDGMNKDMDKELDGMNKDMDKDLDHHDMNKDMDKEMAHRDMSKEKDIGIILENMNNEVLREVLQKNISSNNTGVFRLGDDEKIGARFTDKSQKVNNVITSLGIHDSNIDFDTSDSLSGGLNILNNDNSHYDTSSSQDTDGSSSNKTLEEQPAGVSPNPENMNDDIQMRDHGDFDGNSLLQSSNGTKRVFFEHDSFPANNSSSNNTLTNEPLRIMLPGRDFGLTPGENGTIQTSLHLEQANNEAQPSNFVLNNTSKEPSVGQLSGEKDGMFTEHKDSSQRVKPNISNEIDAVQHTLFSNESGRDGHIRDKNKNSSVSDIILAGTSDEGVSSSPNLGPITIDASVLNNVKVSDSNERPLKNLDVDLNNVEVGFESREFKNKPLIPSDATDLEFKDLNKLNVALGDLIFPKNSSFVVEKPNVVAQNFSEITNTSFISGENFVALGNGDVSLDKGLNPTNVTSDRFSSDRIQENPSSNEIGLTRNLVFLPNNISVPTLFSENNNKLDFKNDTFDVKPQETHIVNELLNRNNEENEALGTISHVNKNVDDLLVEDDGFVFVSHDPSSQLPANIENRARRIDFGAGVSERDSLDHSAVDRNGDERESNQNGNFGISIATSFGSLRNNLIFCGHDEFQCRNGTSKDSPCIPIYSRCDSISHCSDGSDEFNCTSNDCFGNFMCPDGICLPRYMVCDGVSECLGGEDEINCGDPSFMDLILSDSGSVTISSQVRPCNAGEHQCNTGRCIPATWKCDGLAHCPDASDEKHCAVNSTCEEPNTFYCSSDDRCIPIQWTCNNQKDCTDGSDEDNCECSSLEFRCSTGGGCVPASSICDSVMNCADGSDEWECLTLNNSTRELKVKSVVLSDESYDIKSSLLCADNWSDDWGQRICEGLGFGGFNKSEWADVDRSSHKTWARLKKLSHPRKNRANSAVPLMKIIQSNPNTVCDSDKHVQLTCNDYGCGSWNSDFKPGSLEGGNVRTAQMPSVAMLLHAKKQKSCTASIISPNWAITSYSCLIAVEKNIDPHSWLLLSGGVHPSADSSSTQISLVHNLVPHPQVKFSGITYDNDFVLIQLPKPMTFNKYISAICLPSMAINSKPVLCTTAGWGLTTPGGVNFNQILQNLPIKEAETLKCTGENGTLESNYHLCVDIVSLEKSCDNDSGEPLMCANENGTWELQGILTNHMLCGRTRHPAIFGAIYEAVPWIRSVIGSSVANSAGRSS